MEPFDTKRLPTMNIFLKICPFNLSLNEVEPFDIERLLN